MAMASPLAARLKSCGFSVSSRPGGYRPLPDLQIAWVRRISTRRGPFQVAASITVGGSLRLCRGSVCARNRCAIGLTLHDTRWALLTGAKQSAPGDRQGVDGASPSR
jgi:hypothetical protein